MDVLWFRLSPGREQHLVLGRVEAGQAMVMLDRGDYWQCALLIRKGTADAVKREGLVAFRDRIAKLAGRNNADEIHSLDDVRVLTVTVDRLRRWHKPGLLFIGDSAHAMSPIGGVGVNLAIQDAIAAANLLAAPLRGRCLSPADLRRVQERRMFPTIVTQSLQTFIQRNLIDRVLRADRAFHVPVLLRLMQQLTLLQRLPAYIVGVGVRPEHIDPASGLESRNPPTSVKQSG
jgi:2-polyprenyl-6-methoxyphenol hydroxylase-like FAD-dependent oxidoreductase